MKTLRQLVDMSKKMYSTRYMRHQWIRKTYELEQSGKHARFTGGWGNEQKSQRTA